LDKTFLDEARTAARGVWALLMGDRAAPGYFLFSQAGMVGSFIAVLAVTTVELVFTSSVMSASLIVALVQNAVLYAAVLGTSYLYLRQIARLDAFLPFIVALNWSNAILSIGLLVAVTLGLSFLVIVAGIAAIVVSINIARLIMTLKPLQIALLIIAQVVGIFAALILLALVFPISPEQAAEVTAAAGSLPS
jgi:hypothetical protein